MRLLRAQGATEYLVLLAVVLVIALVGIALLGFFPGTANDAQVAESEIYWKSASPVSILETSARWYNTGRTYPYMKLRNSGNYPIRITGVIGDDGYKSTMFYADNQPGCNPSVYGTYNISDYFYLAPGEEMYVSSPTFHGTTFCRRQFFFLDSSSSSDVKASALCQNSTSSPGIAVVKNLGFEYNQYVEGQQITKRQVGAKPLMIKCREPI